MSNYGNGSIKEVLTAEGKHYTPKKWRIMASYTDDNGKRQRPSKIIYGNKTDAQKALNQLIKDIKNGVDVVKGSIKFEQFANDWLKKKEATGLKKQTADNYRRGINALVPFIGHKPISSIKANDIENAFLSLYSSTKRGSKVRIYATPINQIFKSAYRLDLIASNPMDKAELPTYKCKEKVILDTDSAIRLNALLLDEYRTNSKDINPTNIQNASRFVCCYVAMNTGLRLGELLALTWGDITLGYRNGVEFGYINVSKTLTQYGINATKTDAGKREVAVDSITASLLFDFKSKQAKSMETIGLKQTNESLLVSTNCFASVKTVTMSSWFSKYIKRSGFDSVSFHSLRHTHATLLVSSGVDIKTVQNRLGHASSNTTLDFYAHALPEKDKEASDIVSSILNSKPEEKEHRVIKFA